MKLKTLACSVAALAFLTGASQAVITVGVNNALGGGRRFSSSTNVTLGVDAASLHVGYFLDWQNSNLTSGNLTDILTKFIPLGEGRPGLGSLVAPSTGRTDVNGRANLSINGVVGTTATGVPATDKLVQGTRLFVLVYNAGQTEFALLSDIGNTNWLAPNDDPSLGGSSTLAVNIANFDTPGTDAARELFWGTYRSVSGTENYLNLAPVVPEPGTTSIGLLAALGLLGRRRR